VYTSLSTWGAANTFTWTPAIAGAGYQIEARARSAWNSGDYEARALQAVPVVPRTTTFTVAWDAAPDPNVTGYYVYVGPAPGIYTSVLDVGNVTRYTYVSAVPGSTYFLTVAAYDTDRAVSLKAREVTASVAP
jgi:hypothetical protein